MTGTDINYAAELLRSGKLVAIPTETVYGLAANALNTDAVIKIFEAKNRPRFNPVIIHIGDISQLSNYVITPHPELLHLAKIFWPGPLTFLFKKKPTIHDIVTAGLPYVAVRIPDHPLTLQLLQLINLPLAAPSANPFGYISPTEAFHVETQLGNKVDYILDGGSCKVGIESTIIKLNSKNQIEILRQGFITIQDLQSQTQLEIIIPEKNNPIEAPGMMKLHYAPLKRMLIGNIEQMLLSNSGKKIGVLSFKKKFNNSQIIQQEVLSTQGDLSEAARNLFAALHRLDNGHCEIIYTELFPHDGIGIAINDKLYRGAAR
ncbi:MAG: threonylcarbamoyl-AMP synthase [Chitinophagales bacterium]|nr:threonylcarbamoyl-AMP synthase [Bacteroidota bacterium]MBP7398645.1 threonylcarbamoyl-AMP synthase [Chitinophagales bacterium]MBK8487676.1 threonylcarbamoyl-AMP synthase [Bacteroidota bacterium]MBK8682582.1 threonylcarbamoyl-AMP synthase [Bacteroidota bacterium]MBP8753653.1 threonylcarbamoyl-AMP synthase [Chitinophagales bacterium]